MRRPLRATRRDGAVLPLVTICLVGIMAFIALAIDVGMMAVARTECQAAADIGALAGARTLDGNSGNNVTNAVAEAKEAAKSNYILTTQITNAQITTATAGVYKYNTGSARFVTDFVNAPTALEAYGAMRIVIVADQETYFGRVLGVNSMKCSAVSTAVHRPRDINISLDFSGSMKFSSEFNYPPTVSGSIDITGSLNPDSTFPRFGPWAVYPVATTGTPNPMQRLDAYTDTGGENHAANNMTMTTANGPPIVNNFQTNQSSTATNAFVFGSDLTAGSFALTNTPTCTPAPATWVSQYAASYAGDRWPLNSGTSTTTPTVAQYAKTVKDMLGLGAVTSATRDATFETNGASGGYEDSRLSGFLNTSFKGYSMGPGYYGKSFYMWPPDPRYTAGADPTNISGSSSIKDTSNNWIADWRKRFFLYPSGSAGTKGAIMDDNTRLFSATGVWQTQNLGATAMTTPTFVRYIPNYDAILKWLKNGPQTLPSALRAGRVLYYDAIPNSIPMDWQTGLVNTSATVNERFWKEYIDFVVGAGRHTRSKTLYGVGANNTWAGNTFGTGKITATTGTAPKPYMTYDDCPVHPRLNFWFGPLTMLAFMSMNSDNMDFNWMAATTYEAQTWQLRAGIRAALSDIQKNHPNDLASLNFWSSHNGYSTPRATMGKSYTTMTNALYYPFSLVSTLGTLTSEKRPYKTNGSASTSDPCALNVDNYTSDIPCGDGGTNPTMGLMNCYNQFNWTGTYTGRKGAAKIVILETDGVANQKCNGTFGANGSGNMQWTSISNGGSAASPSNGNPQAIDPAVTLAALICQDSTGSKAFPTFAAYTAVPTPAPGLGATSPTIYTSWSGLPTGKGAGFSTTRQPAYIHTLAFGELFETSTTSLLKTRALEFLRNVQIAGNTSAVGASSIESYKIITGNSTQRIDKIKEALERIMQGGINVALVE